MKFKKKKKCRFINLAEQLTLQNDIVSSTVDSMLDFVTNDDSVQSRSDFDQIQKTADQDCELNPVIEPQETSDTVQSRPKLKMHSRRQTLQDQKTTSG